MLYANFVLRRLLLPDVPDLQQLYAFQHTEHPWATLQQLSLVIGGGTAWGGFIGGSLGAAWLMVPRETLNDCAFFMRRSGVCDKAETFVLPPLCLYSTMTQTFCDEMASITPDGAALALPVKTGQAIAAELFGAGFVLGAMRPLACLRPHYIFFKKEVHPCAQARIMLPWQDTLALSRSLGAGNVCIGIERDAAILVPQEETLNESSNTR